MVLDATKCLLRVADREITSLLFDDSGYTQIFEEFARFLRHLTKHIFEKAGKFLISGSSQEISALLPALMSHFLSGYQSQISLAYETDIMIEGYDLMISDDLELSVMDAFYKAGDCGSKFLVVSRELSSLNGTPHDPVMDEMRIKRSNQFIALMEECRGT
jgi:hypothetical protein